MARLTLIPANLHAEVAKRAHEGWTPREIRDWLQQEQGVEKMDRAVAALIFTGNDEK